jgi:hypothetical protein
VLHYNSKLSSSCRSNQASSSSSNQVLCYNSQLPSDFSRRQAIRSSSSLQQLLVVAELCWLRFRLGSQPQRRFRLVMRLQVLLQLHALLLMLVLLAYNMLLLLLLRSLLLPCVCRLTHRPQ